MFLTQQQADTTRGEDTPLHGEDLFVIATTGSDHITLPFFTQSLGSNFCDRTVLMRAVKCAFIIRFGQALGDPASSREGEAQLHPEAANYPCLCFTTCLHWLKPVHSWITSQHSSAEFLLYFCFSVLKTWFCGRRKPDSQDPRYVICYLLCPSLACLHGLLGLLTQNHLGSMEPSFCL